MKSILSIILSIIFISSTNAQIKAIPGSNIRSNDTLYIGYFVTTSLVFDAAIWNADRGSKGIILEKQSGITNVLNLKANKLDFKQTNVHVYTSDGKMFTFPVVFSPTPLQTTLYIRKAPAEHANTSIPSSTFPFKEPINEAQLHTFIETSRTAIPFVSRRDRTDQTIVKLRTIHYVQDLLFISLELVNRSPLPYDIDFIRLYVQDKGKIKRSTMQQREITPIYKDAAQTISTDEPLRYVIVIPKFTLGTDKQFYLEVFEKNGGRHLAIKIKNRHLLQAKQLTNGSQK